MGSEIGVGDISATQNYCGPIELGRIDDLIMKWNSTLGLTLVLLMAMLMAGFVSAVAGMSAGREALKGITQPDTRPTNNLANRKGAPPRRDELVILQEDKIIATVKARTAGEKSSSPSTAKAAPAPTKSPEVSKFPMISEGDGVTLTVKSVQKQGDLLLLSITLQNANRDPVKFLYSFLELKDDQGRTLSANTEGLPSELPANSQAYPGTIRVPIMSMDKVEKLSLALADYPDQQIRIEMSDIPVVQ
jgi:hypothetical protein